MSQSPMVTAVPQHHVQKRSYCLSACYVIMAILAIFGLYFLWLISFELK
jgi:hypothetical protein